MSKSRPDAQRPKPWWSKRHNRNQVWLGLVGALSVVAVGLFVWFATQGGSHSGTDFILGGDKAIPIGEQVEAFELPDVVSGESFSLADYLGKQDIALVSYMGFF